MSEHAARRQAVRDAIGDATMVLPSAPVAIRNNDVEHEYRQDSDLFYLTGFDEPETVLVLSAERVVLFVRSRDPDREVWDGARAGVEGAVERFGADVAHPIETLDSKLPELLQGHQRVYARIGRDRAFDDRLLRSIERARVGGKQGKLFPTEIVDPGVVVHELRLRKSGDELRTMDRATEITREAHLAAMAQTQPGMYEYEVEGILRSIFRRRGSERPAYAPIVGSGPNATVLHHIRNDRQMKDGELLLIDAGAEFDYYAADVTRTFPVGGKFTTPQRELYDVVLDAQLRAIERCQPGSTLDDIHEAALERIAAGLIDLNIVSGSLEQVLEEKLYRSYFMHKTSHFLGMDVHDVGLYYVDGEPRPLEPNMVLTVEPGIYIAENSDAPERYRGIGIRIEDDVAITEQGHRVLSDQIPKTAEEVERVCAA